jgi:CRISPR-associated exonuclease Cas4
MAPGTLSNFLLNLSIPLSWVGILAVAAVFVGLALVLSGKGMRQRRGLTDAKTLDLDGRNLYSARYGLAGRPDRIVEGNIPEEWKSGRRVYDSHRHSSAPI